MKNLIKLKLWDLAKMHGTTIFDDFSLPSMFMTADGHQLSENEAASASEKVAIKNCEIHMLLRCSDARDVSGVFADALNNVTRRFAERGTIVQVATEGIAGTFVTPDVIASVKRTLDMRLRDCYILQQAGIPIRVFFHLITHGELLPAKNLHPALSRTPHAWELNTNGTTNCGMMGATKLVETLEQELLINQPTLEIVNFAEPNRVRRFPISSPASLQEFMKAAYGHDGLMTSSWIEGIENLPAHILKQKDRLREGLARGYEYTGLPYRFTASVQNYTNSKLIRVDNNTDISNTFLDQVFHEKQRLLLESGEENETARSVSQQPKFVLFYHSDIPYPRLTAMQLRGMPFETNSVFGVGTSLTDSYYRAIGPYKILGVYLCVTKGVREVAIMGRTPLETQLMMARFQNDPLGKYLIETYNLKLIPLSNGSLSAEAKRGISAGFEKAAGSDGCHCC